MDRYSHLRRQAHPGKQEEAHDSGNVVYDGKDDGSENGYSSTIFYKPLSS